MKILLITSEEWNDFVHGNNVLTNWFQGFDAEFAQIYCSPGMPNNGICSRHFRITDSQMLRSISLAGLKQTMAMGFSLLAFNEFYDKRYVRFAIFFLLAYWCHTATLAFGFVIYYFRNIKYFFPLVIVMTAIAIFFGSDIWVALITGLEDEHYIMYAEADNTYTAWTFVFYLLLLGIIFFNRKAYTLENK